LDIEGEVKVFHCFDKAYAADLEYIVDAFFFVVEAFDDAEDEAHIGKDKIFAGVLGSALYFAQHFHTLGVRKFGQAVGYDAADFYSCGHNTPYTVIDGQTYRI